MGKHKIYQAKRYFQEALGQLPEGIRAPTQILFRLGLVSLDDGLRQIENEDAGITQADVM